MIASHLVNPYDITVSWNNIAGLSQVIDEIKETVIFPVQRKELLRNSVLTKPPKGIFLIEYLLFKFEFFIIFVFRSFTSWSSRMWKNNDCESNCEGSGNEFFISGCVITYR